MAKSMSSSTVSSFWKEQARATLPWKLSTQKPSTSSALMLSTVAGSGSVNVLSIEQHLLQRVSAQPEAQRLERDHLVGRDVPEVDRWAELLDEPGLGRLRRRLEDDVRRPDHVGDLPDQLGTH